MIQLFHEVSRLCSKVTTQKYSTSFCSAIRLLHKDLQAPIYNIYGFVRFADEIVDTFHDYDKAVLLQEFEQNTWQAIERKISLNPILHSFQQTVHDFGISHSLVSAFFKSMKYDLDKRAYDSAEYREYIYGSAEVVGLMCLSVFCERDMDQYERLKPFAQSLGAAFQKVNFLRDVKADFEVMDRTYFPDVDFGNFTHLMKSSIEDDILKDFKHAFEGISQLPFKAKFGVYVAYKYYYSLFNKIRRTAPAQILHNRIRIPNYLKAMIVMRAGVKHQLKLV
ncbi:MAG: phytoene/squalene synthase family protein [Ginsengibacter sp.]